jgi:hypothetical protein
MAMPVPLPAAAVAEGSVSLVGPSIEDDTADPGLATDEHLKLLVGYFQESEDTHREARERSERCRDYYCNIQLSAAELAAYRKRGQAPIYVNYVQRKVDTLCGIERRSRSDPKAFPRNPNDEQTANAATDSLRFVSDQNRFNSLKSEVFNEILVEGTGGALIDAKEDKQGGYDINVQRVAWDRLWWDPHSRALNFSDAAYKGIVIWMELTEARRKWPDRMEAIEASMSAMSLSETYDDRPKYTWHDSKRKRIRVVECHYKHDDEWMVATYTKGGFLIDPVVSPYLDKDGNSTCPLVMRSGFVNRENERFGHTESLIPLQDEINKRRAKALHLLSVRQTFGNKTAIQDVAASKLQLARPDGHLEINGGAVFGQDFGILPTGDMAQGQVAMLEQALAEMNATGANAAMQGKDERAQSGRALQTRAQMGATELEPQTDGLREWTHEVYEALWMRVRQFWTGPKWVRVTDDDRNVKFVGLNKPVTVADKLEQMPEEMRAAKMQQMGILPNDPRLQQVVEVENEVSGLDVDIVLEEGPDLASLQSEQFEQLVQLASAPFMNTPAGPVISPTVILKASSLRNKDALIQEQEKHQAASAQGGADAQQGQQAQQAAMMQELQAKVAKLIADAELSKANAALAAAKTNQIEVGTHIEGVSAMQAAQAGHQMSASVPVPPPFDPNKPQEPKQ